MYVFATMTVFTVVTDLVLAESKLNLMPKDPVPSDENILSTDSTQVASQKHTEYNPLLNSMWVYSPNSHPADLDADTVARDRVALRPGVSITRLAKSLVYGFDPYFLKAYFEPFETRPKPVKLVAFKKHGRTPRMSIRVPENERTPEIAELQSPFNEVGTFWLEEAVMQQ